MSINITDIKTQKIGKRPVVVLPLDVWEHIAEHIEELEMSNSESFRNKIKTARKEKKLYSSSEARRLLKI